MRLAARVALALALLGLAGAAACAPPPRFSLPIGCDLGRNCAIQNYVDHDPTPGWRDYTCGRLSYDGHKGTDFRLLDLVQMRSGVPVLAAADGLVIGARDGEPDISVAERGAASLRGREAGNGVRLRHADGWETQYSHMRRGSVRVSVGQRVHAGDELGLVGLSGNTEFPHVDFAVSKDGRPVDPFAPSGNAECGTGESTMWLESAMTMLGYRPTGLVIAGFSSVAPTRERAEAGEYSAAELSPDSASIAFWVELFGVRTGDRWTMDIQDPAGATVVREDGSVPSDKAIWFTAAGKRRGQGRWPAGRYRAHFALERASRPLIGESRELVVR